MQAQGTRGGVLIIAVMTLKITESVSRVQSRGFKNTKVPARVLFSLHLPKRLTKSPTEKDPKMPPTEKMATETDQMAVSELLLICSWYRWNHVSLIYFSITCREKKVLS